MILRFALSCIQPTFLLIQLYLCYKYISRKHEQMTKIFPTDTTLDLDNNLIFF